MSPQTLGLAFFSVYTLGWYHADEIIAGEIIFNS